MPKCAANYHFPCAAEAGCTFYADMSVFCPRHEARGAHVSANYEQTTSFVNKRRWVGASCSQPHTSVFYFPNMASLRSGLWWIAWRLRSCAAPLRTVQW